MKNKFKKSVFLLSSLMMLSVGAGIISGVDSHVDTVEAADGTWTLVTDASTLAAGDKLVIASNAKGVTAGDITSQYLSKIVSTFSTDKKTITSLGSGTVEFTLGGTSGSWTLANDSGKLLGATAVKKVAWGSGTTTWSISISDNDATIQNGTATYGRFLYNTGSPRFTTYTSNTSASMLLPQLYKFVTSGTGGEGGEVTPTTYTVSYYDGNTKYEELTEIIDIVEDQTNYNVTKPADPVKENYTFVGWYTDSTFAEGTEFDFTNDTISDDINLYAKFEFNMDGTYALVTDVNDLSTDTINASKIIIAASGSNYALSTTQNGNNRGQAPITKSENVITFGADTQILTLEDGTADNTYAFNTGSGYLYAASSSSNHLKTETTLTGNSSWTIDIQADGVATIKATGTNTHNWLRYNSNNSLFSCYESGQQDISLYRKLADGEEIPEDKETFTITLNSGDFAEFNSGYETVNVLESGSTFTLPTSTDITNKFASKVAGITLSGFTTDGTNVIAPGTQVQVTGDIEYEAIYTYPTSPVSCSIALANEIALIAGDNNTPFTVSIKGYISSIDTAYSSEHDNITFTLSDGINTMYCYRVNGGSDLVVNDKVTVEGNLINYNNNKIEIAMGGLFSYTDLLDTSAPVLAYDPEEKVLSWENVEGATKYIVIVKDSENVEVINETIETNSYSLTSLGTGQFNAYVKAIGDYTHNDSNLSAAYAISNIQTTEDKIGEIQTVSSLGFSYEFVEGTLESKTITFDDTSKRTEFSTSKQVWVENGITMTNEGNCADYSEPVRLYKNSTVTISSETSFNKIQFNTNTAAYATTLSNSITEENTVDGKIVVVKFDSPKTSFEVTLSEGQVRMDSITVSSGEDAHYEFDNIRMRFAATVSSELYEELDLATAEVGFKVTDGTKTHNINCTGKFAKDGDNYFIMCSIWNISTDVEFTSTVYFVIDGTTYYGQSTTYTVKTLAKKYVDYEDTLLAGYSEEDITALKAFAA